jgi:hypothetical protein
MITSMLVILRDRGLPLPAGAVLISPWVDLTHSFPSVAGDNPLDYIPPHGFHQRPSTAWPPPNSDDLLAMAEGSTKPISKAGKLSESSEQDAVKGYHVDPTSGPDSLNEAAADASASRGGSGATASRVPGAGHNISIEIDGKRIEIKDQIQMYASNQLISHPLVSPVLQPSLGGLPPLLILTGGGEMLRDEQIYVAHKAANPAKYAPGDAFLDEDPLENKRDEVHRWKPTDVQLQVWDDLCHVAPTLSFTRPAKYMYRSVAQFGAWALARAQKTEIEILDDDAVSVISQSEDSREGSINGANKDKNLFSSQNENVAHVGKAGDPLPPFRHHMIRQRVDRHGNIYALEAESELPGCNLPTNEIGVVKKGPVKKWIAAKKEWDTRYASAKRNVQKQRMKEMAAGYATFGDGEVPPPSALAGRRRNDELMKEPKKRKSMGLSLWALWGSKHDKDTMVREVQADRNVETTTVTAQDGAGARPLHDTENIEGKMLSAGGTNVSRSRSHHRNVRDENQTTEDVDENTPAAELALGGTNGDSGFEESIIASDATPQILVRAPTLTSEDKEYDLKRPKAGGIAFPFTVKQEGASASMTTLTSSVGVPPAQDVRTEGVLDSGVEEGGAVQAAKTLSTERPGLETFVTAQTGSELKLDKIA